MGARFHNVVLFWGLLLVLLSLFTACSTTSQKATSSPTKIQHQATPQPTQSTTPQAVPTGIFSQGAGWREVMHLGTMPNNIEQDGGAFEAKHTTYQILSVCDGTGTLQVNFAPSISNTIQCQHKPVVQGATTPTQQKGQIINVSTVAQGNIVWEVSIQEKQ